MTKIEGFGFQSVEAAQNILQTMIQANATNYGGFTVREDFEDTIIRYLRKETILWQMLRKRPAGAAVVKKIREGSLAQVGFVNRSNLSNSFMNDPQRTANDLSDPGQEVKAIAGCVEFGHFDRSLHEQQNKPFNDVVSDDTNNLLVSIARTIEMGLFLGDATADPMQFNGIDKQMAPYGHVFEIDLTGVEPDDITQKLCEIVVRATTDRNILRRISHIFCSGAGTVQLTNEVGQAILYQNQTEIVPGVKVPAIMTQNGTTPIVPTPYIQDLDGGAGPDIIRFYLIDLDSLEWRGVYPLGGEKVFEPQMFDVTQFLSTVPMLEKRLGLIYGTLYANNRGEGIYRLDVKVPSGTVWNNADPALFPGA